MVVLHPLLLYSENMVRFFGWHLSRPVSAGWYERSNPDLAARSIYPKKNEQYVLFPVWLRQMLPGSPNKNRPHLLPAMLPIVPLRKPENEYDNVLSDWKANATPPAFPPDEVIHPRNIGYAVDQILSLIHISEPTRRS